MPAKFVGRSVPRLEDRPLLTGQGRFAADISFPDQWHMRVVRSPVAHGKIKSIDARAALALPGVHAVWTACRRRAHPADPVSPDRPQGTRTLPAAGAGKGRRALCRRAGRGGLCGRRLSRGGRRRTGRAFESIPCPQRCARPQQPGVYRARSIDRTGRHPQRPMATSTPPSATRMPIVSLELSIGRHSGVPMETRGAIARYDAAARHSGDARRRQSAALEPRRHRANARPRHENPCSFTKAMSAAASAFAAKSIPRIFSSAPPR